MLGDILHVGRWGVYCTSGLQRHRPRKRIILHQRIHVLRAGNCVHEYKKKCQKSCMYISRPGLLNVPNLVESYSNGVRGSSVSVVTVLVYNIF